MDSLFRQVQVAGSEQMIAYVPGSERALGRLAWVDERGRTEYVDAPVALFGAPDLSDDGRRLALHVGDVTDYVWIYDFARREGRRLAVSESSGWPVWSPDGETLAVGTWRDSISDTRIVTQRAGGGAAREIEGPAAGKNTRPSSWSPDGRVLAIGTLGADQEVSFAAAEGTPAPRPAATFTGHQPAFSPDGRWVAYISAESGQVEIFVRSYPDGATVRQVSTGGGLEPVWCRSGEVFYRNGNRWMSVRVRTQPGLQWDTPRLRFETDFVDTPGRSYDVSPDGTRLLVVKRATADVRNRIELVVNWQR